MLYTFQPTSVQLSNIKTRNIK